MVEEITQAGYLKSRKCRNDIEDEQNAKYFSGNESEGILARQSQVEEWTAATRRERVMVLCLVRNAFGPNSVPWKERK